MREHISADSIANIRVTLQTTIDKMKGLGSVWHYLHWRTRLPTMDISRGQKELVLSQGDKDNTFSFKDRRLIRSVIRVSSPRLVLQKGLSLAALLSQARTLGGSGGQSPQTIASITQNGSHSRQCRGQIRWTESSHHHPRSMTEQAGHCNDPE